MEEQRGAIQDFCAAHAVIEEIMAHSQFRRNTARSPLDPEWGKPNPIDITGLLAHAFRAGGRWQKAHGKDE